MCVCVCVCVYNKTSIKRNILTIKPTYIGMQVGLRTYQHPGIVYKHSVGPRSHLLIFARFYGGSSTSKLLLFFALRYKIIEVHRYRDLRRGRLSACSLTLKVNSVLSSALRASHVSSPFWLILQCLFGYPLCVHCSHLR